jgi:hypothetical protein
VKGWAQWGASGRSCEYEVKPTQGVPAGAAAVALTLPIGAPAAVPAAVTDTISPFQPPPDKV